MVKIIGSEFWLQVTQVSPRIVRKLDSCKKFYFVQLYERVQDLFVDKFWMDKLFQTG